MTTDTPLSVEELRALEEPRRWLSPEEQAALTAEHLATIHKLVALATARREEAAPELAEGSDGEADLFEVLAALHEKPDLPSPRILALLGSTAPTGQWRDYWQRGKDIQRERGLDAVPPKTECEVGAGFWSRLRLGLRAPELPEVEVEGLLQNAINAVEGWDREWLRNKFWPNTENGRAVVALTRHILDAALARQQAVIAELRRGYDARGSTLQHMGHAVEQMEAAEATADALKRAVERIAELRFSEAGEPFDEALDIADAALKALTAAQGETTARPEGEAQCDCFGDLGLHASTHGGADGRRYCDMCGKPVRGESADALTAINSPAPSSEGHSAGEGDGKDESK